MSNLRICSEKYSSKNELKIIDNKHNSSKYKAAFMKKYTWKPYSDIKIKFIDDKQNITWTPIDELKKEKRPIDPLEYTVRELSPKLAVIEIVEKRIIPIVGLNIIFIEEGDADVRVSFDTSSGSWSLIGTDCKNIKNDKEATINFGWLDVSTILHEFGHVLGMIHEHQSSFNNYIKWDKNAVMTWAKSTQGWTSEMVNENILHRYDRTTLNGTDFDKCSIMLYFFPASLTINNIGTNQNNRLSSNDVVYISNIYPGGSKTPRQFYKSAYKEELFEYTDCGKSLIIKNNWIKYFFIYFIIIVISIIIIVIIYYYYKKLYKKIL